MVNKKDYLAEIGNPILREKTEEVDIKKIKSPEIKGIIYELISLMRHFNGAGLAANQIFYKYRICVIELNENQRYPHLSNIPLKVLINPKIQVLQSELTFDSYEGCLSVPNLRGKVSRYCKIQLDYYDQNAKHLSETITGYAAVVYQHEIDHLDGILFTDRVKDNRTLVTYTNYLKYHHDNYLRSIKNFFRNNSK